MADAIFKHGDPTMMDFVPDSDVAAGDVIVTDGGAAVVAHLAIKSGETGAVATGGGSYEMTASAEINIGDFVYFDSNKVGSNPSGAGFGVAESYASGDNEPVTVKHDPFFNWD